MRVVIDADGRAVFEMDPRRALDLREQQIGLILEPADFEAPAGNRAVFDLGPIVIGHELAAPDLAKHLSLIRQTGRILFEAANEQIRRTAIDRHVVDVGPGPGAVDHGLVVAGDEARILAEPRDLQGQKMRLEKGPRLGFIADIESFGGPAGLAQRSAERLGVRGRLCLPGNRLAADAERLVGQ